MATPTLRIKLKQPVDSHTRKELRHLLPELAASALVLWKAGHKHIDVEVLSLLVGTPQLMATDVERALADAEAIRVVYHGTEWLTSDQLAELADLVDGIGKVRQWQRRGRLFAIRHHAADYFPRYALGWDFRPLPAVARVIRLLKGMSDRQLAQWFECASDPLSGARPREIIAKAPERVVAAAQVAAATRTNAANEGDA